jgi:ABC-type uncharacterized transport system permease subunit
MDETKTNIMHSTEILIPIVLFISTAIVLVVIRKFTNDERLALIEKGGDANIFTKKGNSYPALRYGLLLIGGGVGILVGNIVAQAQIMDEEAAMFSFILICGGAGLFASYYLERRAAANDEKN